MKKFSKLGILGIGALVVIMLITMYGEAAVKSIAGLAIAQSATKWNSIKDAAFGDNATKGIMAVNTYLYDGTNFDRQRGDSTNGMDVDITRLPGGGNTPADAFTTPTNTLNTNTFNMLYNGTTWDMARGDSTNGTLVNLGANNDVVADTELGPAGIVGDNEASPTATLIYNFPAVFDGSAWDRMRGDSVNGILVNLGANNDIVGTKTTGAFFSNPTDAVATAGLVYGWDDDDGSAWQKVRIVNNANQGGFSQFSDAGALAVVPMFFNTSFGYSEAVAASTDGAGSDSFPASSNYMFNGTAWDRVRGTITDGLLVNLGTNNDITVTSGNITSDTEFPAASALADGMVNPTTPIAGAAKLVFNGNTWDRYREWYNITSCNAVTVIGPCASIDMTATPKGNHTLAVIVTGAPSSLNLNLEGSIDNINWFVLDTSVTTTSEMRHVVDKPVFYIRANLTSLVGGTTPTVTAKILSD